MAESNGSLKFDVYGDDVEVTVDGEVSTAAALEVACWCMEQAYYIMLNNNGATEESVTDAIVFMQSLPLRSFHHLLNNIPEDEKEAVQSIVKNIAGGDNGSEEEVEASSR